jgi:tRNA A-37 threonylcarbamoyl transferase component Bud32
MEIGAAVMNENLSAKGRPLSPSEERRVDQHCTAFEQAWKAGQPVRIEDWLPRVPESEQGRLLQELILVEVDLRRALKGESPEAGEYKARFADRPEAVTAAFQLLDELREERRLAPTIIGSAVHDTSIGDFEVGGQVARPTEGPDEENEPLPETIGRYSVLGLLGKGTFGRVYLAKDPRMNRQVAIKVAREEQLRMRFGRERFLADARSAARLSHPGVVHVYDVEEHGNLLYIVQEYIDGLDLDFCISNEMRHERWPQERIASMMGAVARALAYAHKQGLVHRDLKPANILIDCDGNPHVADFGLAIDESTQRDHRGELAGSPAYMSPEQVRREAHHLDGRSDIWSLGVILYELATGSRPFNGADVPELYDEILNRNPKPPRMIDDKISPELERIILKCLAKPVTERYTTALELARELQKLGPRPQRWWWVAAAFVAIIFSIGILWWPAAPDKLSAVGSQPSIPPAAAPLRVTAIEVEHYARTSKGVELRGLLGQQAFTPVLGDQVRVKARLSKPACAYLIAFRPDGEAELCYPESEDVPPSLTDTPQYPLPGSTKAYGLREGTGLWVFAAVASEKPLPAYRNWLKDRPYNKPAWSPIPAAPAGIVWWGDGPGKVDILTAVNPDLPMHGKTRSKGEALEAEDPEKTINELTASLRTPGDGTTASAIGFCVVPRD